MLEFTLVAHVREHLRPGYRLTPAIDHDADDRRHPRQLQVGPRRVGGDVELRVLPVGLTGTPPTGAASSGNRPGVARPDLHLAPGHPAGINALPARPRRRRRTG